MTRLLAVFLVFLATHATAHEGMWIPSTLSKLVMNDMQNAGLKLSADEIYAINQSSLKDAIVLFGGGCTASVISDQGLILTNHHCGYSQIQSHASLENDYLKNGFWAENFDAELTNPGLSATFVVRIEDVTEEMQKTAAAAGTENAEEALRKKALELEREAVDGTGYKAEIKPFFYGNAFYMIVTETYRDVRLVGAPPSSIGKFGGDTDNWVWPRHTGDFSLFRIYASPDNQPADYSEDNVPLSPKRHLKVNTDGVEEGDFTMIFGFPGRTFQYITSPAVEYILETENPARIAMREASLGVIDRAMEASDKTRIQYASKQSRISNAYKKWIGQNMGLKEFDVIEKKKKTEEAFLKAAMSQKGMEGYSQIVGELASLYAENEKYQNARNYLIEFYYYGPEILRFAAGFRDLVENYDTLAASGKFPEEVDKLFNLADGYFKDYNSEVDRDILAAQLPLFHQNCPDVLTSETLNSLIKNDNYGAASDAFYDKTVFADREALEKALKSKEKKMIKTLKADPAYCVATELLDAYGENVAPAYRSFSNEEEGLMSVYMKGLMELLPEKVNSPDANSTLRLSYGKMEGVKPRDGIAYTPYTTLSGIMAKYIPGDKEFDVPAKLMELHEKADYGPYGKDGELRVCFLGSHHTTGGNSGSPTINARGELVGLNFDRTYESTMSDIMFSEEICRNIMVDVNYILFITDKFAGAGHLVEEMDTVSNPVKKRPQPVHELKAK
ncbi:MAG: S46 family peptidase [Cryomorphaceae bacterium]|nr:S46 family peptidase [Flavobacteriales bacterium]